MTDSNSFGHRGSRSWFWPWLFIAALALALIMCLWMHIKGPRSIQTAVSECVAPVIGSTSLKTGNVSVHGRDVHLSGEVDSGVDQTALVEALEEQSCTNKVVNNLVAVDRTPSSLQVTAFGDTVTLTGELPSQADIDVVHAAAGEHFGADNVQNQMQIVENGREPLWINGVDDYMANMALADPSGLDANDERIILTGMVRSDELKGDLGDRANAAFLDAVPVDNQIEVRLPSTSASLLYASNDDGVVLTGEMPDQDSIDQAVGSAGDVFGEDRVVNNLVLNEDVKKAAWLAGVGAGLPALASAAGAKLGATDDGVTIEGLVDAPEKRQAIEDAVRANVGELPIDNLVVVEIPKTTASLKLAMPEGTTGRVQISGQVADTGAVDGAVAAASGLFSEDRIDNSLAVTDTVLPAAWLTGLPEVVAAYEGADNGSIEVNDGGVVLTGLVDADDKKEAAGAAAASLGLAVDNQIEVVARGPASVEYLLESGAIELTGELASDEQVDSAVGAAEAAFGADMVTNSLTVGERLADPVWLDSVNGSLANLKAFESGRLTASDSGVTLDGVVAAQATRDTAVASLQSAGNVEFSEDVKVMPYASSMLNYTVAGDRISLQGTLSSQQEVDSAAKAATNTYGAGNVDMGLSVGDRHSPAQWLGGVNDSIADLQGLESGELQASDSGISITGITAAAESKDAVVASLGSAASDVGFSEDIQVMPYSPAMLKYTVDGDRISLSGTLATQEEVGDAAKAAISVYGSANVENGLTVGERYSPATWLGGVNGSLVDLKGLENGVLEASDSGISITGITPEQDSKDAVVASLSGAAGDIAFSEEIQVLPYTPSTVKYRVDGDRISLIGTLSSQEEVDSSLAAATDVYGDSNVDNGLTVGERNSAASWLGGVNASVVDLKGLESGELQASDSGISISGITAEAPNKEAIVASLSGAAGDIAFTEDVKVMPYTASSLNYMVDGDRISLAGTLSTQGEVDGAVAAANSVYGADNVTSELTVGERYLPATWLGGVNGSVAELVDLESGQLEASDGGISITGITAAAESKEAIVASLSGAAGDIAFTEDVKVMPYTPSSVKYMVDGDRISLAGTLSSQGEVDGAVAAANSIYGADNVTSELTVGDRYLPATWLGGVNGSVAEFVDLESGQLEASDSGISITGITAAAESKEAIVASLSGAAGDIAFTEDVKVMPYTPSSVKYMVDGDRISLAGTLSSQDEVGEAAKAAISVYGSANVENSLGVGERYSEAVWLGGVNSALVDLKGLESGELTASDGGISIIGITAEERSKEAVVASLSGAAGDIAFSEDIKVMPYAPSMLKYMVDGDRISLEGTLSSQGEVDGAVAAANSVYGADNVESALVVGERHAPAGWLGGVNGSVADLTDLESGQLEASDSGISITGITAAAESKEAIVASLSGAAGDIAFTEDVKVMPYTPSSVKYMVDGDRISLEGTLSSQGEVDAAVIAANNVYGADNVESALVVGERYAAAGWLNGVNGSVADLTGLENGELEASDSGISIKGITAAAQSKDNVIASLSSAAGDINFSEQIQVLPYSPSAVKYSVDGDRISLQGTLSSQGEVDGAMAAAGSIYGAENVENSLEVGERYAPATWLGGINGAISDMKLLETGALEASDGGVSVTGITDTEANKGTLVASVSGAAGSIAFSEDVQVVPYTPSMVKYMVEGDRISLQGTLSSQDEVDQAAAAATNVYGAENVDNGLAVGERYSPAGWLGGINQAVTDLAGLETGVLEASNDGISVKGITDTDASKDAIVASTSGAAGDIAFSEDVRVMPYSPGMIAYTVSGSRIRLEGTLATEDEVADAAAAAVDAYGEENVDNALKVGDRYTPSRWLYGVNGSVAELKLLENGELRGSEDGISVTGVTDEQKKRDIIVGSVRGGAGAVPFSESVTINPRASSEITYRFGENSAVSIAGSLADQAAIDVAAAGAEEQGGAASTSSALTVGDRVAQADWLPGVVELLADMKTVTAGEVRANDSGLVLNGTVESTDRRNAIGAKATELLPDLPLDNRILVVVPVPEKTLTQALLDLNLPGIQFETNSAELRPDSIEILDGVVEVLKEFPDVRVEIAGHTDSDGEDEYNLELSSRRTETVMNYLGAGGVNTDRLDARGYGESRPVADNSTAEGKAINRRIELNVLE